MVKWTHDMKQRLLMLYVKKFNITAAALYQAWIDEYGEDDDTPKQKAIADQLYDMKGGRAKGKANGSSNGAKSSPAAPRTPKTKPAAMPKTPTSSAKRKRGKGSDEEEMTEEDDEEPGVKEARLASNMKRASISRRGKGVNPRYQDPASDADDDEDATDSLQCHAETTNVKSETETAFDDLDGNMFNYNFDGAAEENIDVAMGSKVTFGKQARQVRDNSGGGGFGLGGDESDVSNYSDGK